MRAEVVKSLQKLPKIDTVLGRDDIRALDAPRWAVRAAVRDQVAAWRERILSGAEVDDVGGEFDISRADIERRVRRLLEPSLRRVINATGVVLHTNLGRAPLARATSEYCGAIGTHYSNLEYDLDAGRRGSRHSHLAAILRELTGAEDAVCVNNNAAAVMLCLAALAAGREVIVSRGELIEIGGSFRIPDVMKLSGATLVEVGTTNKTRAADYRRATGENTALYLKVHQSNFAIVGFTEEMPIADLAELGRDSGIPTMMDLGSGSLLAADELRRIGLEHEPGVAEVIAAGIELVTFSGDKLLGGPQAGIICGRRVHVEKARRHPLMRALRPGKSTMAALLSTLALYRDGRAHRDIPAVAMLSAPADAVRRRAQGIIDRLGDRAQTVHVELCPCRSKVGGGAMPLSALPSFAVALRPRSGDRSAADIEKILREGDPAIITRVSSEAGEERVLIDLRTVLDDDLAPLEAALAAL